MFCIVLSFFGMLTYVGVSVQHDSNPTFLLGRGCFANVLCESEPAQHPRPAALGDGRVLPVRDLRLGERRDLLRRAAVLAAARPS